MPGREAQPSNLAGVKLLGRNKDNPEPEDAESAGASGSAAEVAEAAEAVNRAIRDCGCTLNNAIMQHVLLALVVIPELRISDLGLVDVTRFALTEVVAG